MRKQKIKQLRKLAKEKASKLGLEYGSLEFKGWFKKIKKAANEKRIKILKIKDQLMLLENDELFKTNPTRKIKTKTFTNSNEVKRKPIGKIRKKVNGTNDWLKKKNFIYLNEKYPEIIWER